MSGYYAHSGRFSLRGLLFGVTGGLTAGVALGAGYAYALAYIPLVYLNALLPVGFGAVLGLVTADVLTSRKLRNTPLGLVSIALVTAVAWYASWAVWAYAVLARAGVSGVELGRLALDPGLLRRVVGRINEVGAWSLKGSTPTGGLLWAIWSLEALVILGASLWAGAAVFRKDPFCEACETWCIGIENVAKLGPANTATLVERLESGDLAYLESLGLGEAHPEGWTELDLHRCPGCDDLHALTVRRAVRSVEKGREKLSKKEIVKKLLLTKAEAEAICALPKKLREAAARAIGDRPPFDLAGPGCG
jgi:hypothetical protein